MQIGQAYMTREGLTWCTRASSPVSFFRMLTQRCKVQCNFEWPPSPPILLQINGAELYDVRTDIETWHKILKKTLSDKTHPGIIAVKTSFEAFLRLRAETNKVYVLEEGGKDVETIKLAENHSLF